MEQMALCKIITAEITDTERSALKATRQSNMAYAISNYPFLDADGTLILTNGSLSFEIEKIRDNSELHGKPCLHLDFEKTPVHLAPQVIRTWVQSNQIQALYVSGPDQSDSPDIIESTRLVISRLNSLNATPEPDFTESVIQKILEVLSFEDKIAIANLDAMNLGYLQTILNRYPVGREPRLKYGKQIYEKIWSRLYGTHRKITVVDDALK